MRTTSVTRTPKFSRSPVRDDFAKLPSATLVNIRPATINDLPAVMLIERQTASAAHWSEAEYAALFGNGSLRHCLVVEDDQSVLGFLVARGVGSEWEIENVAVDASEVRQGIGSQLVQRLLTQARARGGEAVFLEVRESNQAARSLYEKCGFSPAGRRKAYYVNPIEDAVLYRFSLR